MIKTIFINLGRLLMLGVWSILLLNLVQPFPSPLKYFMHVAMIFMFFMHGLQLIMLKTTLPRDGKKMGGWQEFRIFMFGIFELLAWQQKQKP